MAKKLLLLGFCLSATMSWAGEKLSEPLQLRPYRVFAVKALEDAERLPAGNEIQANTNVVQPSNEMDNSIPEHWDHRGALKFNQ